MRIGLFFGSFDPPHIGHVNIVTSVLNSNLVDHVIVVPAFQNAWKSYSAPYAIRCEMCKYAFNLPKVSVSSIELDLSTNNLSVPTYKVLQEFTKLWEDIDDREFCIITTQETASEIPKWDHGDYIMDSYMMFVEGVDFDAPYIDVHSKNIRSLIRSHKIPYPFISKEVLNIISKHNLYI